MLKGECPSDLRGESPSRTIRQTVGDEPVPWEEDPADKDDRPRNDGPAPFDDEIDARVIQPDEKAVDRVLFLRRNFAANEIAHQNGARVIDNKAAAAIE